MPYSAFKDFVKIAKDSPLFAQWMSSSVAGVESTHLAHILLGALRYVGHGWTFDDIEESTAVSAGKPHGNRFSGGRLILGKTEGLWDNIYKSDTKDQADTYLRTTEAITDYVGVEYSRDMRMLVKKAIIQSFTEPTSPKKEDATNPFTVEKFKTELQIYHKAKKEYKDHTSKVFVSVT